jgi:hypothetical protein
MGHSGASSMEVHGDERQDETSRCKRGVVIK